MAFDPNSWNTMSNDQRFMGFSGAGGMGNLALRDQIAQQNFGGNQDAFNNWFNTTSYTNPFQRAQPATGGGPTMQGANQPQPIPGVSHNGTGSYDVNSPNPPLAGANSTQILNAAQQNQYRNGANSAGMVQPGGTGIYGPAGPSRFNPSQTWGPPVNSAGGALYNPGGATTPPPTTPPPAPTPGGMSGGNPPPAAGGGTTLTHTKGYTFNPTTWGIGGGGSASTFGTYKNPWGKTSWG